MTRLPRWRLAAGVTDDMLVATDQRMSHLLFC